MEDEHVWPIDSNLLLLYLIGKFEPSLIRSFRRTQQFSEAEFQLLTRFVGLFDKVLTLPNILTEVSNLAGQLPEDTASEFRESFRESIDLLDERYCESSVAAAACRAGEYLRPTPLGPHRGFPPGRHPGEAWYRRDQLQSHSRVGLVSDGKLELTKFNPPFMAGSYTAASLLVKAATPDTKEENNNEQTDDHDSGRFDADRFGVRRRPEAGSGPS
jgi:hypothetical protein